MQIDDQQILNEEVLLSVEHDELIAAVEKVALDLVDLLKTKNRKYGNAITNPLKVFSKAGILARIRMRMDDKIGRIRNEQDDEDEDPYVDLTGYLLFYLALRWIVRNRNKKLS